MPPFGGRLTVWLSLALVAMSSAILLLAGSGADGVAMWVRATARSSLALLLLAYVARPLRSLWRSAASAWLLRNRRALGVSMAVSHALHLIGIIWYFTGFERPVGPDALTIVFGGLGFVLLFAMAATSTDAAVAWLGRARWQSLHRIGMHYVWFINAFTLLGPALGGVLPWLYGSMYAAIVGAALLRAAAFTRSRRRAVASPA